jgi:small ligand-binding sensory domain FIST
MTFAAALSEHPETTDATGEVVGAVLERLGGVTPDLAVVFASAAHAGSLADVAAAVRGFLSPATLLGVTASSIIAGEREVEDAPSLALWAGAFRTDAPLVPVRLDTVRTDEGLAVVGLPAEAADGGRTLVLVPDPFTFPAEEFLVHAGHAVPTLRVVGGLASAGNRPGVNRLLLDDVEYTDGAVGVLLPPGVDVETVVSQGCRPIGDPMIVTRAEGNVLHELAGRPALERLAELVQSLPPDDRELAARGIHLGRVIDERKPSFERGDFVIRNVLGGDREAASIAVGDVVEVGSTVQFQVRDAASADEDLRALLAGRRASGALVFTCNGRGSHLFGHAGHDAELVSAVAGADGTAGMFCAGELGPIGGRSFLHGFTASVVLFSDAG